MAEGGATACLTLRAVLDEIGRVTEWYQLGIELEVDTPTLKTIEANHKSDLYRCKTEAVDWWLLNAAHPSWATLAKAVEKLGGHANLVTTLRQRAGMECSNGTTSSDHSRSGSEEEGLELDSAVSTQLVRGVYDLVSASGTVELKESDLEVETYMVEGDFNVFFTKVRRALEQKGLSVADFLQFLEGIRAFAPVVTSSNKPLLAALLPRLRKMKSFGSVFQSLMDYCSWFNYLLIDKIIEAYCEEDESVARAQEKFNQRFHTYCKHRVSKCRKQNGFGFRRKKDYKKVMVKVDRRWDAIRVQQLAFLRRCIARVLCLNEHTLYLCTVEKGCVQLLFLVPAFVAEAIFPPTVQQELALTRSGILQLTCGDYHFPMLGYEKELTKCEQATVPKSVDNALGVGRELPKWHLALSTTAPKTVEGKGLLKACMEGDWEAASAFLESGSYVGERDEDGRTPLMHACKKKKTDFVVKLLEGGADFTDLDVNGHCCLHFPETLKNTELAQLLIGAYRGKRFSVDLAAVDNNHTPLMVTCTIGDSVYPTAELLLKNGANPDGNANAQCRPLIEASARGYTKLVRLLLQHKANTDITDQSGSTALLQAINCHQFEIAFLLLDRGVNVNRQDHTETTPLFSAVTSNSYELVEKLIDKGANIDASRFMSGPFSVGTMGDGTVEETPLAHACARGFLKIVELLIQKGADMNYLCSGTVPPLGFAIICKQMHVVSFLTRHSGLDRTIRGLSGPIIIAVKVENLRCAKMMLECLGGLSEALRAANMNQMYQLIEHIELYKAVVESVPDTSFEELQNDPDPIQARLQSAEHSKFEATIHRFCQICVAAVVNNPNIPQDGLISCAAAIAGSEVADFFSRCFTNTQRQNTLRQEFLSGNPSPSKFLIDNRMLTEVDVQIQALQFYPEGTESFFSDLVKAFQQLPGGHTLPNNVRAVLQRFFSGQFQVGCQIGLLGARGATYLPEIPCEVSSYGHSQWPQTTQVTAPIAVSSDSGSSNYTPMIDGVPIRQPKQLPSQGDTVLPPTSTHINAADADSNTSYVRAPSSTQMPEPHQVNDIDGITSAQDDGSGSEGTQPDSPLKPQHPERPHPVAVHEKKNPESPPLTGGNAERRLGSPENGQQGKVLHGRSSKNVKPSKLPKPGFIVHQRSLPSAKPESRPTIQKCLSLSPQTESRIPFPSFKKKTGATKQPVHQQISHKNKSNDPKWKVPQPPNTSRKVASRQARQHLPNKSEHQASRNIPAKGTGARHQQQTSHSVAINSPLPWTSGNAERRLRSPENGQQGKVLHGRSSKNVKPSKLPKPGFIVHQRSLPSAKPESRPTIQKFISLISQTGATRQSRDLTSKNILLDSVMYILMF